MKEVDKQFLGGAVGIVFGFVVWFLTYLLVVVTNWLLGSSAHTMHLRFPILILIAPIVGAVMGFKAGPRIVDQLSVGIARLHSRFTISIAVIKLLVIGPIFWAAVVVSYSLVFSPFGSRIDAAEWLTILKIILFPTAVSWAGMAVARFILEKR